MLALKSLIFIIFVPGTVTILVPYVLLNSFGELLLVNIGNFRYLGVIPVFLGVPILLWCIWDFTFTGKGTPMPIDPPKKLVVRGLHQYVRNPMYVGAVFILAGETIIFASLLLFGYTVFIFLCFHIFVIGYEEPTLRRTFGGAYEAYCESVPRWFPHHFFPANRVDNTKDSHDE
jgi:protein-S-isoprenylcysteine O-methyltransferase Ste14